MPALVQPHAHLDWPRVFIGARMTTVGDFGHSISANLFQVVGEEGL